MDRKAHEKHQVNKKTSKLLAQNIASRIYLNYVIIYWQSQAYDIGELSAFHGMYSSPLKIPEVSQFDKKVKMFICC